jgi:hypothetical protein
MAIRATGDWSLYRNQVGFTVRVEIHSMATLAIQASGVGMAAGIAGVGIQGLRGVPDSTGKVTPKGVAVACLIIAALLGVGAVFAPFLMWGR